MKPKNLETINRSFQIQAANFERKTLNFIKEDYLNYTTLSVAPKQQDTFLEVAAGTCVCGRSFAPLVQTVVCLDATPAMLQKGKQEAEESQLQNMVFITGLAEELPFLDNSFDIVFSRLAFHHFVDVQTVFREMARVLKLGGKLVLIDMEAAEDDLRAVEDEIETLRDPSHVRNLSKQEMLDLFADSGLTVIKCETTEIQQKLVNWLDLTKTPEHIRLEIIGRMQFEINGQSKTGFCPYLRGDDIYFNQKWVLFLGEKLV